MDQLESDAWTCLEHGETTFCNDHDPPKCSQCCDDEGGHPFDKIGAPGSLPDF
jgi:hypothetical protein